eukprot:gb/GECG01006963.1/.p1 GENE.gb/GECG01006963.1/~~gb/GECG01006963.1/.p1  ORF type:complete len:127 (+),score=19.91 gb/GECG01006963.1/:1-381(+)
MSSEDTFEQHVAQRQEEVQKAITAGNNNEAIRLALQDPPFQCKDEDIKQKYARDIVLRAFSAIRDEKIGQAVKELPESLCDTAMKYVYRFLQETTNCGSMLKWHAALTKKAGVGSIVRVMTDRRTA